MVINNDHKLLQQFFYEQNNEPLPILAVADFCAIS